MGKNASGIYVIDEDYNIVRFNHAAAKLYPTLKKGEKCYRRLMNQDVPCVNCPVLNHIEGPKTHLDRERNILATVDAIEIELEDGRPGHALVFSDVTRKNFTRDLAENTDNLQLLGVINVLGNDYTNVYSVRRSDHHVQIFRFADRAAGVRDSLYTDGTYEPAVDTYIKQNVFIEDQSRLQRAMDFDNVCERLQKVPQFVVHYRVLRDGEIHYYYVKIARIGDADSFDTLVVAFANEDMDVRRNEMDALLKPGGTVGRRKILIVEDNELNREILTELLQDEFDILTAENGEIGLKVLAEHYRDISVVLLDVCMPVCDGFEFLERIQGDVLLSSVPVIVTTGSNRLEDEERSLELGAVDFVTKPYNAKIVRERINGVIKLRESAAILSVVEFDDLTGLYTKQAFFHHVRTLIRYRNDQNFTFVVADVKNFKWINSVYGEKTGDDVLVYIGKSLLKYFRKGLVCRYGGDQFACVIYGQEIPDAQTLEDMSREIAAQAPVQNLVINYGIYKNVDKSQSMTIICDRAFLALKSIKDNYEGKIAFYDDEMIQKHLRERMLENDFEAAVRNREFVVYLQPKYSTRTEQIVGAEALVRWKKPDGSMISPGEFIPLYEKNGQIVQLDEYIFRLVCSIQRDRMKKGQILIPVSVNLSRASLHYDGMIERYVEIIEEMGIPFSCVPIELTETAALYNVQIKELTEKLVETGFQLHMDDFGSGYSSMTSLNMLPFNVLKLDKSLIDFIDQERGRQVIRHTIALAHGLGMEVLAEGVEEKGQVDILKGMDCDEIQGFYYSRPLPYEEFCKMETGL